MSAQRNGTRPSQLTALVLLPLVMLLGCQDEPSLLHPVGTEELTPALSIGSFGEIPEAWTQIPEAELNALIAFYEATDGDNWTNNEGWLDESVPPSEWHGVFVQAGHVSRLSLTRNSLVGHIPSETGNLSELRELRLGVNELVGTIPKELEDFSSILVLDLGYNILSGDIPSELGNLTSLRELRLKRNRLTGEIPLALGTLASLEVLDLSYNELTGPIPPELKELKRLRGLYLSSNALSGPIPPDLKELESLKWLHLSYNALSGPIPPDLGGLTNLASLSLPGNHLTGPIPVELENLSNLTSLSLNHNDLTGPIPVELAGLSNLTHLYLGGNNLGGTIPPELGELSRLQALSVGSANLSGAIPPALGRLSHLEFLVLEANELTGPIPPELGDLSALKSLWLGRNKLSGGIPHELAGLEALEALILRENDLVGPIPPALGELKRLEVLVLDHTELSGPLPHTLTRLSLYTFSFHNTDLCEPPDEEFQAWLAGIESLRRTGVICEPSPPFELTIQVSTEGRFILVDPSPMAHVPLRVIVSKEGEPVEGARISVGDVRYGATDENGELHLRHPVGWPGGWPDEGLHTAQVSAALAEGFGASAVGEITADLYSVERVKPREGQICAITLTDDMIRKAHLGAYVHNPANFLSPGGSPALRGVFALASLMKRLLGIMLESSDPRLLPGDVVGFEVVVLEASRVIPSFGIREWHYRADGELVHERIYWTEDTGSEVLMVDCSHLAFEGLAGTMASPASIRIVDEAGRIVGTNPQTGEQVLQFPGFINAPGEGPVRFFIPIAIGESGQHTIHIIGEDHGSVNLELAVFNAGALQATFERTFEVHPGKEVNFTVYPDGNQAVFEVTMQVEIDILPESEDNPINPSRAGLLPVAFLNYGLLNVHEVDVQSIRFGRSHARTAHDLTDESVFRDHVQDVNDDGREDLMLHFNVFQVGIEPSDDKACLSAMLKDGLKVWACDRISIVGDTPKKE